MLVVVLADRRLKTPTVHVSFALTRFAFNRPYHRFWVWGFGVEGLGEEGRSVAEILNRMVKRGLLIIQSSATKNVYPSNILIVNLRVLWAFQN